MNNILLTSFQTWLPHQVSNASDDLLEQVQQQQLPNCSLTFLRRLPVDSQQASQYVLAVLDILQSDVIVCCGMAECRKQLTVESNARCGDRRLTTAVNLNQLVDGLDGVEVSHDAGQFVCEALYYEVLNRAVRDRVSSRCIFVHVPPLNGDNRAEIVANFLALLRRI
ncbi:MAG: peptidase C15 [Cyanobacteriota bacterium]|nr:peptidase C15 [Cyanobacteriota bacterium]